jgi:hypothetical protein
MCEFLFFQGGALWWRPVNPGDAVPPVLLSFSPAWPTSSLLRSAAGAARTVGLWMKRRLWMARSSEPKKSLRAGQK